MATYGKYTGYEPVPDIPGAYSFQVDGGKPVLAGGQAALDLKARLDAANAATQTAGTGAGGFKISGLAGKLHDKGVAQNNADLASVAGAGGGPPMPSTPEAPKAPAGPQPHMVNGINTGYIQGPDGRLFERVAGSAGTSREQLQKKSTQGTALPTAESETTSGGFAPNQEFLDARQANTEKSATSLNEMRDAEITAQEAGRAVAGEQFVAQTAAAQRQQELVGQIEAGVQQQQAVREQAIKDYAGTRIDPERVFSGGAGFAKRLGAALAAGFGAYGAAINRTQNFAGEIVDNMIARDINAQEVDLRTKKDAADSALADLTRRGMSLDQAKNTLTVIQKDWARQQLELAKGQSGSDVINAKYDAHLAKLGQDQLDADEKYRQDSLGKVTKAVQSSVMYPQAGSAGGLREVAPGKALSIAGQTAGVEGQVAGTAKAIGELENTRPGGGKVDPKAAAALATADLAMESLDRYGDNDIPQTLANQDIASATWHRGKDLVMGEGTSARGMSERDRALIQDTEAARGYVRSLTSVLSGQGALSGSEAQEANKGMAPGATVGDLKRAVAVLKRRAEAVAGSGGSLSPTPQEQPK